MKSIIICSKCEITDSLLGESPALNLLSLKSLVEMQTL